MVASRCGVRAPIRFCAVVIRSSTSSGVRYSRGRRSAFGRRRGGTFPFSVVGPLPSVTRKPLCFIGPAYTAFPFIDKIGKVEDTSGRAVAALVAGASRQYRD